MLCTVYGCTPVRVRVCACVCVRVRVRARYWRYRHTQHSLQRYNNDEPVQPQTTMQETADTAYNTYRSMCLLITEGYTFGVIAVLFRMAKPER